jgi:hypothetical protein
MSDDQIPEYRPVHEALARFAENGSFTSEDIASLRQHQLQRNLLRARQNAETNWRRGEFTGRLQSKLKEKPRHPVDRSKLMLSCDSGWNCIGKLNGGGFDFGSGDGLANQAVIDKLPSATMNGFTIKGANKVALADPVNGLISIGTGIGSFFELSYPATVTSGAIEGSVVSASLTKVFVVDDLRNKAPNVLTVAASFSEPNPYAFLQGIPGEPTDPEGGRVSSWGLAYVDVTLGVPGNPKAVVPPPADTSTWTASAFDYLWFMTGLPDANPNAIDAFGYPLLSYYAPINTAGPDGGLVVTATIPAPWKGPTVIQVDVTVELSCYRATGSSGFSLVDCSTGLVTPPIWEVDWPTDWDMPPWTSSEAPISVDGIQICGI